ncbi:MAG: hypothetical protein WC360_07515, partial [Opitutales bacterium]
MSAFRRLARASTCLPALPAWLALASLGLAFLLAPFFNAGTHPLLVEADLAPGATLYAELADGWSAPLVRVGEGALCTELPPRRAYTLSLRAGGGACRVTQAAIADLSVRPVGTLLEAAPADPAQWLIADGGAIQVCRDLAATRGAFTRAFLTLFCLLWLLSWGLVALVRTDATLAQPPTRGRRAAWALAAWVLVLACVHVWLVATATPLFWWADSVGYAGKALAFFNHGTYDTGQVYFELSRAP